MNCKLHEDRKYICCVHASGQGSLAQCRLLSFFIIIKLGCTGFEIMFLVVIDGREDGFVVQGDWWRLRWHLKSTITLAAQGRLGSQKLDFVAIRAENRT